MFLALTFFPYSLQHKRQHQNSQNWYSQQAQYLVIHYLQMLEHINEVIHFHVSFIHYLHTQINNIYMFMYDMFVDNTPKVHKRTKKSAALHFNHVKENSPFRSKAYARLFANKNRMSCDCLHFMPYTSHTRARL